MDTTRKYPRTLEEAFGPTERGQVYEKEQPKPLGEKVAERLGLLILVVMLGAIAMGWM